jgi:hypothetical protein
MADNAMLIGESFVSKASVVGDEHAALTGERPSPASPTPRPTGSSPRRKLMSCRENHRDPA